LVEQAMFFLAGLLVAGLAGLLVLPAFARRALRLSEARARMLAPLSMKEVVAERDLLRAEHAIEQHRLDRRIAALQEAVGRHRADLGRQAAMLVELESRTARLGSEISGLHGELAARGRDILGLEGDLGASRIVLNDFSARLDEAAAEIASLRDARVALETLSDQQRTVIAGLETRASGLEMKLDDSAQAAKAKASAAEAERARLASELASRANEVVKLTLGLDEAMKKGALLVADLEKKDAELQETRRRLSEVEAALAVTRKASAGATRELPRVAADEIRLETSNAAQGDAALREAISRLAGDIARLSGAAGDGAAPSPAGLGKAKRRESGPPASQEPEASKGAASGRVRQLQSTAPER
jgi:DNA repair exonuclease SbcCD ATPase subunit